MAASNLSIIGGVIVNFRICGATYRTVSPSSRGVRTSEYVRCKAPNVIFSEKKKFEKIFSQKKVMVGQTWMNFGKIPDLTVCVTVYLLKTGDFAV